ncbi:MAG: glucose-phosphate thymidylyltransferase [Actinoallomurus sp.]|jgi:glucose-1-phosphate thymidylyltransferase|nr:glucose-phosphate thymidylyltransferase [Actinoallomurus sp.]
MPKQLIPIANKPVLAHIVENLRALGISQVGIVVGDHAEEIRAALGDGSSLGVQITYVRQDAPRGLADCLKVARAFLREEDFVVFLGDNMLPDGVADVSADFRTSGAAAEILVHRVDDPRPFGVAEVDADHRVTRLTEKPDVPATDLAMIGVYFFTPAIHEAVASIGPSLRGELEITDAIQWMVERGRHVRAKLYTAYHADTGTVEEALKCNRELLKAVRPEVSGKVDDTSELIGPVLIEQGAHVIGSRIVGPAIIGGGTLVEDSYVGPHTSVGEDCVLTMAGVGYSIVLNGATISGVRGINGSIIGRQATVTSAAGQHRLMIGDHTDIQLAVP